MTKRTLIIILVAIAVLLSIPFIAMQFTDDVDWSFFDFVVMGGMLLLTAIACVIVVKKVSNSKYRIALILTIIAVFCLIWAEIGVGIFGTPLAGS